MLTAPKFDNYISEYNNKRMGDESDKFTKESWEQIREFYKLVDQIKPCGNDNEHILYFKLPRGSLEDYGNYEDYIAYGEVESKEEFIELWEDDYPKKEKWYKMFANHFSRKDNEFYVLAFNNNFAIQNEEIYDGNYASDISDIMKELISIVREIIEMIKNNKYNSYVETNLDKNLRYGTIARKDYYNLFENIREDYLNDLKKDEINKFEKNIKLQISLSENNNSKWKPSFEIGRLERMNAKDFYNYCLVGYNANKYNKHEGLTAKEAYYKYADGRDEGLKDIEENSYEEFEKWFNRDEFGGHPWEVCGGGNSTHISLYVEKDDNGYYLILEGKSFGRSAETIRFYNALKDINAPIYLYNAEEILYRVLENDKIGIVPYFDATSYQESNFPEEEIIDFVHLGYEKEEQIIKLAKWQEIEKVYLKQ